MYSAKGCIEMGVIESRPIIMSSLLLYVVHYYVVPQDVSLCQEYAFVIELAVVFTPVHT